MNSAIRSFFISIFGVSGFLISGFYLNTNLLLSFGFVNVPAFLIFIPITTFMARIGAKLLHKVDKNKISKLFGTFLLIVASKFIYDYFPYFICIKIIYIFRLFKRNLFYYIFLIYSF